MSNDAEFESLVQAELQRLEAHPMVPSAMFRLGRVGIRICRILGGVAVGLIGWWIASYAAPIVRKPLAALTLADLVVLVGLVGIGMVLVGLAVRIAFGAAAPPRTDLEIATKRARQRLQESP
ncbi:MAG TPA: hypothetical protein VFL96_02890 [Acidobacteriaceae bacterium]|nr:hypothetical protein [Acidobacteriaceae bacterium]